MKKQIIKFLDKLPYIRGLKEQVNLYEKLSCFEIGNFYSPIVDQNEINKNAKNIWKDDIEYEDDSIDYNLKNQLELLELLTCFYHEIPFVKKKNIHRYYFENGSYSYTDGIILYSMIRHLKPKKIIEIGSGFSSALMLDVNDLYFDKKIHMTFIEPYPFLLKELLNKNDLIENNLVEEKVQNLNVDMFKRLDAGDILFVDSSHVVKTGSDVHFIFFEILPILKKGVIIHFHDIFTDFEYPKEWVLEGRNWNENYILRAFLTNNKKYSILFFSHYLHHQDKNNFHKMPLVIIITEAISG